jgi:hypothetical protein
MSCREYGGSSRGFYCSNYISDEKLVFVDAQYADIGQYESTLMVKGVAAFLGFLSNECKNAAGQLFCGVSFPDCEEGAKGKVNFPKPVCRIPCQNFVAACMEDFLKPGGEVDIIKGMGFTFPECDAEAHSPSWDRLTLYSGPSVSGSEAVTEMFAGTEPFPESSVFVSVDGVAQEVQCFNPGKPSHAVNYCDADLQCGSYVQVCFKGNAECVFPCPSPAFTTEQYNQQFIAYTVPGLVALVLNATLLVGLVVMSKALRKKTPFLLRWSFLLGLLYGLINTVPVVVLKHDLSCNCLVSGTSELDGTELCQGRNSLCTLSGLGVFLPIGILYLVAGLNIRLYLTMTSSPKLAHVSNGMMFIAFGVPLLGCVMRFVLDFDPVDRPDRELASFVQVRDSFSCSPRFPSLWSEFGFKQAHYLIGSMMTAAATFMPVKLLLEATAHSTSKGTDTNSRVMEFVRLLRKANGERLVVLGLLCIALALGTLVVSIQTVSLMKQFREESKARQACLVSYMIKCGGNNFCESEVGFRCKSHDDCIDKAEYCSNESRCKPCYLCALDNDGVGNVCPTSFCQTTSRMDPRLFCAFDNCAPIISKLASNPFTVVAVTAILSGDGCINGTCSELEGDLTACVSEKRNHPPFSKAQRQSCSEISRTCEDPFLQFEGCECSTNEFGGYENGGCFSGSRKYCYAVNPDKCVAAVETWNSEHEEAKHLDLLFVEPMATVEFGGIDFEAIYLRSGCCYETCPYYTLSDACPRPEEIPNGEMIVGFFFLNCIGLVCPLAFIRSSQFQKGWSALFKRL